MNRLWIALAISAAALLWGNSVIAQDGVTATMAFYSLDNIVLLFSAILVLFMQAGFAAVESGLAPVNNTVNIMFKNFTDLCVGVLLYYAIGYSIMYGTDASGCGLNDRKQRPRDRRSEEAMRNTRTSRGKDK